MPNGSRWHRADPATGAVGSFGAPLPNHSDSEGACVAMIRARRSLRRSARQWKRFCMIRRRHAMARAMSHILPQRMGGVAKHIAAFLARPPGRLLPHPLPMLGSWLPPPWRPTDLLGMPVQPPQIAVVPIWVPRSDSYTSWSSGDSVDYGAA